MHNVAYGAFPFPFTECQIFIDVTTVTAKLAGCIEAWNLYEQSHMFDAFLLKSCKEPGERRITYCLRLSMVMHHPLCVEILYAYCNVVLVDNIRCRLLNGVVPLVSYLFMASGELLYRLPSV